MNMFGKRVFIVLSMLIVMGAASAAPVDGNQAAAVARSFWSHTLGVREAESLQRVDWQYGDVMHLFVRPQGGWMMVSADDCARPVLAYSTTGTVRPEALPGALQNILDEYRQAIEYIRTVADAPRHEDWDLIGSGHGMKDAEDDEVGPLLSTTWYQQSPYNMYCPSYCMTGCVATSTSQVMKYWNYPAFGRGSHAYTDDTGYQGLEADFGNTRYDWEHMPARLTGSSSTQEKQAVATLMFHVGVSVNMHYSTMYSGTTNEQIVSALPNYFRYNADDIHREIKGSTSNDDWTDMLIAELRQLRPVVYGGSGPAGGHSFVCDGFDSRRYLHFNLGEDGDGDGYYVVGAISYGMYTFNQANDAVLGIHPEYGIYLSEERVSFTREGGQRQLWLSTSDTSSAAWSAQVSADWITISDNAIDHLGQLTVTVGENTTGAERTGVVVFTQGSLTTSLSVVQEAYDPATDYCPLTVVMENTHNEPWSGDAYLSFESVSGALYGTARHTANSGSSTATVNVAPHDVMVVWHSGGALDRYINYIIKNQYGEELVNVQSAYFEGGDVLLVWPCAHVGVDEVDGAEVRCYPNPTSGVLNVEAEGLRRVEVMDMTGRVVMAKESAEAAQRIATDGLPAGMYAVRVVTDRGLFTQKIIKR